MDTIEAHYLNGRVIACPRPSVPVLRDLAGRGYRWVVNLTETPGNSAVLHELGMRELHVPVGDFTAPTPEQIRDVVAAVMGSTERFVIHCEAGLGRTGTIIACLLVASGHRPAEAISAVRAARPGSVETSAQERAVYRYAATITPGTNADV